MDVSSYPRLFAPDFMTTEDIDMLDRVLAAHDRAERKDVADKKCGPESKHTCGRDDPLKIKDENETAKNAADVDKDKESQNEADPEAERREEECERCSATRGVVTASDLIRRKLGDLSQLEDSICMRYFCEHEQVRTSSEGS